MDSLERFEETEIPSKEAFYSVLNDSHISDEDYEYIKIIWKEFFLKNLREHRNLYLKTDVLLLADVFEKFRSVCIDNYKSDPAWYFTAPGLFWDAALKESGVELELLRDVDMLLMIKRGMRGGVSMISKRYARANNKYMGEDHDEQKPLRYTTYLDVNNLYGWAMCKDLPVKNFKWMNETT